MIDAPHHQTLENLAAQARTGDHGAFRRLVERTQSMAFALAFRLLADEDEARDAAQESYIRLWENLDRYDPAQRFETWFYKVVTNISLDRIRSRKRWWRIFERRDHLPEDIPDTAAGDRQRTNAELAGIIHSLTDELPPTQRAVFVLRDLQNLTTEEVAVIAGISIESVKTNLHYARTRIRTLMNDRYHVTREEL